MLTSPFEEIAPWIKAAVILEIETAVAKLLFGKCDNLAVLLQSIITKRLKVDPVSVRTVVMWTDNVLAGGHASWKPLPDMSPKKLHQGCQKDFHPEISELIQGKITHVACGSQLGTSARTITELCCPGHYFYYFKVKANNKLTINPLIRRQVKSVRVGLDVLFS